MSGKDELLVALKDGFYAGRRVRIGEEFTFTGKKHPKWAAPKGQVKTLITGRPVRMGDTKPKAAQEVVKSKATGVNETAGDIA